MNNNQLFSGTIVARGRGLMKVISTGMATKFGQIAASLSEVREEETPLEKKLKDLTRTIGLMGIFLAAAVFFISLLRGDGYFPAFLLSISLAVAVVPEGLPAVMTIVLAVGVKVMAGKKAIIRKLSAIEALGSITLIATDKTGTLTENKMKVKEVFVDGKVFHLDGSPEILSQLNLSPSLLKHPVSKNFGSPSFYYLLLNGILCSTASLVYVEDHGRWDVLGDPTEGALLYLAKDLDLDYEIIRNEWEIINEQPFDSVSKMMSVTVSKKSDVNRVSQIVFSKGAPESILAFCNKIIIGKKEEKLTDVNKGQIEEQVEKWARKGLRVLAFAYKKLPRLNKRRKDRISEVKEMIFLGLVAIHDAPRPEVVEAVNQAKRAGIKTVMITGDNEKTAEAVGVMTKIIGEGDEILNGEDLEKYTDEQLLKLLPKIKIFARTNPFQKYRIVKLYQRLGEIIAVTGDGVNDAVALKQADCGVAMGLVGTDVAREAADMIITDDNFATIVSAVEEGRNIIKNLKNAIKYLLAANVSEAFSLIVSLILGLPAIFYPVQFLYINLITDGLPALALSFSPRNKKLMKGAFESKLTLLDNKEKKYIFLVGFFGALIVLFSYFLLGKTAAFSVLTLIQSFIFIDLWLSHRPLHKNIVHFFSPLFIVSFLIPFFFQWLIVSRESLASLFKVPPVSFLVYIQFVFLAGLIMFPIKLVKKILKISG